MQTILLVGFPNSGKSTIFNLLSGKFRKVSNYSGATVDCGVGEFKSNINSEKKLKIVDLPGIQSLIPSSQDEALTISSLLGGQPQIGEFHEIALVVDLQRFESSLALALMLKEIINKNVVLIVNKADAGTEFTEKQARLLSQLVGCRVIATSALGSDAKIIDDFLRQNLSDQKLEISKQISLAEESANLLPELKESNHIEWHKDHKELQNKILTYQKHARQILDQVYRPTTQSLAVKTEKIDKVVLHPVWGGLIFLSIFYLIFHSIYTWSGPLMDFIDGGVGRLSETLSFWLPDGLIKSFLVDGIIAGVGGVVIFLPQIMVLFFLLNILEQSGYISRAAVLTDKIMSVFGLNGKAFLPYLSGFACSIPAIMATRTIPDKRERMATLMTIPLITCSARLPVYILLVGTFVPATTVLGIFDAQALSFFFLFFLGSVMALIVAKIFRLTYFKGRSQSFIIDLPHYQKPNIIWAFKQSWHKGKIFLKKAGTVILVLSMFIWVASTFPRLEEAQKVGMTDEQAASVGLENSALGRVGKNIEPLIAPLGFDWKIGVGIMVAFGARELFVATMGTLYALGEVDEESNTLRERMKNEIIPATGEKRYNMALAWSILIFFVFALQCTSTLAVARKETEGWKYPMIMFFYMGTLAYVGSFITYQLFS